MRYCSVSLPVPTPSPAEPQAYLRSLFAAKRPKSPVNSGHPGDFTDLAADKLRIPMIVNTVQI